MVFLKARSAPAFVSSALASRAASNEAFGLLGIVRLTPRHVPCRFVRTHHRSKSPPSIVSDAHPSPCCVV